MSQTSTIAFALIVGFIVFITVRGELPAYLGVVGLNNAALVGTLTGSSIAQTASPIIQTLPALLSA